jgi:hypothetical protein
MSESSKVVISEGIRIKKGYRMIIQNVDKVIIDKLYGKRLDPDKPLIIIEKEENK